MYNYELFIIKTIREKMHQSAISYTELSTMTSISVPRLRRCLGLWSGQSMTLSDVGKVFQALAITTDLRKHEELVLLNDEAKTQLCMLIKTIKSSLQERE